MKTNLLLQLHEKAAKTIEAINKAQNRCIDNRLDASRFNDSYVYFNVKQWYNERAEVNAAIAERLKLSYKNILNKINQHQ